MTTRSSKEEQAGTIAGRITTILERAQASVARPSSAEVDEALADGYACVVALEAKRTRVERRSAELFATGRAGRAAARELRIVNEQLFEYDVELRRLRILLARLRDYMAAAVRVA